MGGARRRKKLRALCQLGFSLEASFQVTPHTKVPSGQLYRLLFTAVLGILNTEHPLQWEYHARKSSTFHFKESCRRGTPIQTLYLLL